MLSFWFLFSPWSIPLVLCLSILNKGSRTRDKSKRRREGILLYFIYLLWGYYLYLSILYLLYIIINILILIIFSPSLFLKDLVDSNAVETYVTHYVSDNNVVHHSAPLRGGLVRDTASHHNHATPWRQAPRSGTTSPWLVRNKHQNDALLLYTIKQTTMRTALTLLTIALVITNARCARRIHINERNVRNHTVDNWQEHQ